MDEGKTPRAASEESAVRVSAAEEARKAAFKSEEGKVSGGKPRGRGGVAVGTGMSFRAELGGERGRRGMWEAPHSLQQAHGIAAWTLSALGRCSVEP